MNDREVFKDNLNYYLERSGKLQRDLADYVGAKYTTVSGWTRGISYPRADAMERIANFFQIPTSQLIGPRSESPHLNNEEHALLMAYRAADDRARQDALNTLLSHPAKPKGKTEAG